LQSSIGYYAGTSKKGKGEGRNVEPSEPLDEKGGERKRLLFELALLNKEKEGKRSMPRRNFPQRQTELGKAPWTQTKARKGPYMSSRKFLPIIFGASPPRQVKIVKLLLAPAGGHGRKSG